MGIFAKGESPHSGPLPRPGKETRYKIRITAQSGDVFYWHKRGQLHTVEEDVARVFVANFQPELFQVLPDGSLAPPNADTQPIRKVDMEPA